MVFTTGFAGGKGGRNQLEAELRRLHITQLNSTPNHPTTCGKVERFHQTLKKSLTNQPHATTLAELQTQLNAFVGEYNHTAPPRQPSTPHDPKQTPPPASTPTTASAPTASTKPDPSPCATTDACTTSASAASTTEPAS
jgi:hypothetical protein